MPGADGSVWIKTEIDNKEAQKELNKLEKDIAKVEKGLTEAETARNPLAEQAREYGAALDEAKAKLEALKDEQTKNAAILSGKIETDPFTYAEAFANKDVIAANVKEQERIVNSIEKEWNDVNNKVEKYDAKIAKANTDLETMRTTAGELSQQITSSGKSSQMMAEAQERAQKSAKRFAMRLKEVVRSALIFTVISQSLAKLRDMMASNLKANQEYTSQLAQMKGAWLTAFQPVWGVIIPALLTLMRILTAIGAAIANVFAFFSGKSTKDLANNAKALNEEKKALNGVGGAADDAAKSLAGFDEINKLSDPSSGGGGGGSFDTIEPDFGLFDTEFYKNKLDELTAYVSGALLALGAILAFSGANIPLGIALMAVGAVGLASVALDWGKLSSETQEAITNFLVKSGELLLVIGLLLALTGMNIPLGIGLMAVGAVSLGTAVALNWGAMPKMLTDTLKEITTIVSLSLLAIGAVMMLTGANVPLGLGMVIAGATGLAVQAGINWSETTDKVARTLLVITGVVGASLLALGAILLLSGANPALGLGLLIAGGAFLAVSATADWDFVLNKMKSAWLNIKTWWNSEIADKLTLDFWEDKFSPIGEGMKAAFTNAVQKAKDALTTLFEWISNKVRSAADALKNIGDGFSISRNPNAGQTSTASISSYSLDIPQLATGAVIPPNREFMAVLGDQKQGYNIEAPEELIRRIVREETARGGNGNITLVFEGELAQLGALLQPYVKQEEKRVGVSLVTGGGFNR